MKLKPKYFEDFEVGLNFESEPTLITKEEIIDFASKYDPQSFHLDEEAANNGPFGQLTSSGFMTLGKSFTQIFKTGIYDGTSMGAWGIDELRWTKPVYPGTTIGVRFTVKEKVDQEKREENDIAKGIVKFLVDVYDDTGETVALATILTMVKKIDQS